MAYADYRDLIKMTEEFLSALAIELYGSDKVLIPQFDMEAKSVTRGGEGEIGGSKEVKSVMFNFGGEYDKYDVCEELKIDPELFGHQGGLKKLRDILEPQVHALGEKNI
jgi:lysyl-tRNA synthetase class II